MILAYYLFSALVCLTTGNIVLGMFAASAVSLTLYHFFKYGNLIEIAAGISGSVLAVSLKDENRKSIIAAAFIGNAVAYWAVGWIVKSTDGRIVVTFLLGYVTQMVKTAIGTWILWYLKNVLFV